jgi:nucleoid-associated protein EbfC
MNMNINPFDLLKSAQAIQEKMGEMQSKLSEMTAVGSAGGGMVRIEMNGQFEVKSVLIEKEVMDPNEIPMLQDLIKAAFADASVKIKEDIKNEMSSLTGGLPFPPGMLGQG